MKKKLLIILCVLLAAVLIVSVSVLLYKQEKERESAESTAQAKELVHLPDIDSFPEPEPTPVPSSEPEPEESEPGEEKAPSRPPLRDSYAEALADTDLSALREVNSEVLGWISIPDTRVSYPIMQSDNNDYYLSHSWQKWDNPAGSIFLEYQNAPDFSDFNTLVYGHRMSGGDMFGNLYMFSDPEYFAEHPRIYIVTDEGCRVYEIFSAYEVTVESRVYAMNFSNDEYKQAYINYCLEHSEVEAGVELSPADSFVTLSTCSRASGKSYRYIVQGVYIGTAPRSTVPGQEAH